MIDLTPLDVRNKRGDFKKNLRGYDPQEVDTFLELVAERLEDLVLENVQLRERTEGLQNQVDSQSGREQAVQEALVTAQELRSEMKGQAKREAELVLAEARTEGRRLVAEAEAEARTLLRDAERRLEEGQSALEELERRRLRFLKAFRQLLEREMDVVQVEEERAPLEDQPIDLDLGGGLFGTVREGEAGSPPSEEEPAEEPSGFDGPSDGGSAVGEAPLPRSADEGDTLVGAGTGESGDVLEGDASGDGGDDAGPAEEDLSSLSSAAEEVRQALQNLSGAGQAGEAPAGQEDEEEDDETLSLSFDDAPSDDDDRWG